MIRHSIPNQIIQFPIFRQMLEAFYSFINCVLIGGAQRRTLHRYQNEEMKILNIFLRVGIEPTNYIRVTE